MSARSGAAGLEGARAPLRRDPRSPPARPLRRRCDARRAARRRGRRPLPRLLEEPRHRRDARACSSGSPRSRASRSAPRRCSAATGSTPPRTAPSSTSRCACRARRSLVVDGVDVVAAGPRGARPDGRLRRAHPLRRLEGAHGQADPQRRERRHRRLRPRAGDGLRGAAALHAARPDVPLRLERRLHRLRRGDARPRPGRDALRHLLEDVHDARDDDERALGAGVGARRARRRGRGREALRRRLDERGRGRDVRHRPGEHVRLLGLGRRPLLDGLGDRPLDDARDRARLRSATCSPASTRWTSTSARRRSSATCPRSWACSASGTRTSSARRRSA